MSVNELKSAEVEPYISEFIHHLPFSTFFMERQFLHEEFCEIWQDFYVKYVNLVKRFLNSF